MCMVSQLTFTCSKSTIETPERRQFIADFARANVSWGRSPAKFLAGKRLKTFWLFNIS